MKNIRKYVVLFLIIIVIAFAGVNIFILKTKDFWSATASTCLTMLIALVVSYFFVQKSQDERNQKEVYIKTIEKLQNIVEDEKLTVITSETDSTYIMTKKRSINNFVTVLNKYAKKFNVEKEVQFVKEKASEYIEFWGNHCNDINYLSNSRMELKRPLELMDGKLQEMMLKLYD